MKDMLELSLKRRDAISLSVGEPGFPTSEKVIRAAKESLDNGRTRYGETAGTLELRETIAEKLRRFNKIDVQPDEIMVTSGSSEGLFLGTMVLMAPGESAAIPDPGFMDYSDGVRILRGRPLFLQLSEDDFSIDIDKLKKLVDDKTKILFINSPSNPTGTTLKKKHLENVADFVVDREMYVFSDEAYEYYVYGDAKHYSIASLNGMKERVLTFNTFSKTYSMPGFRVGYCAGPRKIIEKMCEIKFTSSVCLPLFVQDASIEAMRIPESEINSIVENFDRRRRFVIKRLKEMGFDFVIPDGAFYIFPKVMGEMSSWEFVNFLLDNAGVLTVPGSIFGPSGEGRFRISYANSMENLELSMDRIYNALSKHKLI